MRGKDYNHSTYCDLIISGLLGLRPRDDYKILLKPLVPDGTRQHFCLDNILYHDPIITILWDKTGNVYGRGGGLRIFAIEEQIAHTGKTECITAKLPEEK